MSETAGYFGFRDVKGYGTDQSTLRFAIQSVLAETATAAVVKVIAVRNKGEVAPAGSVDVQIMTHQIDGIGNTYPHGTIFNVPYSRAQHGTNGIIMDPQVGDIGVIVCAHSDISSVKATKKLSPPGSFRRNDWADSLYVGAVLPSAGPQQYVRFTDGMLEIVSPVKVHIVAPDVVIEGNITTLGTITNNGHDIGSSHKHGGVQSGGALTDVPV